MRTCAITLSPRGANVLQSVFGHVGPTTNLDNAIEAYSLTRTASPSRRVLK